MINNIPAKDIIGIVISTLLLFIGSIFTLLFCKLLNLSTLGIMICGWLDKDSVDTGSFIFTMGLIIGIFSVKMGL